jgi:hypothetical protein
MREIALPRISKFHNKQNDIPSLVRLRTRWLTSFFFSAILGAALGAAGLLISGLVSLGLHAKGTALDSFDALLIAGMFPLIVLAAHCLDKATDAKKAIKSISYKQK